jgi:hypothetical protein
MPMTLDRPETSAIRERCQERPQGAYSGMPTVLRSGPYRFFFYAGDREEPPHVHVEREDDVAKYWLDPVRLQRSVGFGRLELRRIHQLVEDHRAHLLRSWHEYFAK